MSIGGRDSKSLIFRLVFLPDNIISFIICRTLNVLSKPLCFLIYWNIIIACLFIPCEYCSSLFQKMCHYGLQNGNARVFVLNIKVEFMIRLFWSDSGTKWTVHDKEMSALYIGRIYANFSLSRTKWTVRLNNEVSVSLMCPSGEVGLCRISWAHYRRSGWWRLDVALLNWNVSRLDFSVFSVTKLNFICPGWPIQQLGWYPEGLLKEKIRCRELSENKIKKDHELELLWIKAKPWKQANKSVQQQPYYVQLYFVA